MARTSPSAPAAPPGPPGPGGFAERAGGGTIPGRAAPARRPPRRGGAIRRPRRRPIAVLAAAALLALVAAPATAAAALPFTAIDPGHGGGDTGAVGVLPQGAATGLPPRTDDRGRTVIYEKDVNLDIARRLDRYLRARGARTLMTRTRDLAGADRPYTNDRADLRARVDMANEADVDLFVSVHNNALNATTSGTETFHFYYASGAARALATDVQREVVRSLGLPDRGVKTAGFYVLRHTTMPAILVEGAFLSNPREARLLADPAVRQRIAVAIGRGVQRFDRRDVSPPPARPPVLGPWKAEPRSVPDGYRVVKTGPRNPLGKGGWIAVPTTFEATRPVSRPATLGPWRVRPRSVPDGYRVVKTGPKNPVGKGGWLAVRPG